MNNISEVEVTGVVSSITTMGFNGQATIFKIHCPKMGKTFEAVCDLFCPIRVGDTIYALCKFFDSKLYVVKSPFVQPPVDKDHIVKCLISALKKGFGPTMKVYNNISKVAGGESKVVPFLSSTAQSWEDTKNPELLLLFDTLEIDEAKKLFTWWYKERNLRRLYLFGLNKKEINACRLTCDEIYNKCMENPYTIPAIPLEKCDKILDIINKPINYDYRMCGAIVRYIWKNVSEQGWIATPTRHLIKNFVGIEKYIPLLKQEYGLIAELESVYLTFPHRVEVFIANFIIKMVKEDPIKYDTPLDEYITLDNGEKIIRHSAHFTRDDLSDEQKKAIQGALDHKLCIVTGAAGTSKTTCLGQITHNLELRNISYAVCSFTGKAVSRIREITKTKNPATMHRLIANTKKDRLANTTRFSQFDKDIPTGEYRVVIIDEISMVTTELLYDFLKAYPGIEQLVLIGDVNQLPPIGWGTLFRECLKSETIPTYRLTKNYRVYNIDGEIDGVILNANSMIDHEPEELFEFVIKNNFNIMEGPIERVYDIVKGLFIGGINPDTIVILCPYNRYLPQLNKEFQNIYYSNRPYIIDSRGIKWVIGDRVMLLANDQEIGVFNGETGNVKEINDKAITVDFGPSGCHDFLLEPTGKNNYYQQQGYSSRYNYRGKRADAVVDGDEDDDDERTVKKLAHAFALTVDKAQGSEWDFFIFFIPEFNLSSFLNFNRIYTAITRTKRCCWNVVDDWRSFEMAAVKPPPYRCDNLSKRLKKELTNIKPFYILPERIEMKSDVVDLEDDDVPPYEEDPF